MKRIVTKVGYVYEVELMPEGKKRYFHFVAIDRTQLGSDVIRVFRETYEKDASPTPEEVVAGETDFYAHTTISLGVKMGLWKKAGHVSEVGPLDILFRDTHDCGRAIDEEPVRISSRWYIWRLNEEFQEVGILKGEHRGAEIGVVVSPHNIVARLKCGQYSFVYPGYE